MFEAEGGVRPGGAGADIPRRKTARRIERAPHRAGSRARAEAGPGQAD